MSLLEKQIIIKNKMGLHARPAALFVKTANKFNSQVTVKCGENEVDGKSMLGMLMLGARQGISIIIKAKGPDAQTALDELEKLLLKEEDYD
jgi:phosphotransferase system HPr (HPr) family protein